MRTLARDTYLHIRRVHVYQIGLQELIDGHNPTKRHIWKALTLSQSQDFASQAAVIRDYPASRSVSKRPGYREPTLTPRRNGLRLT